MEAILKLQVLYKGIKEDRTSDMSQKNYNSRQHLQITPTVISDGFSLPIHGLNSITSEVLFIMLP